MAENVRLVAPRDHDVIDLTDEAECRYWARRLGVRPKELKAAIRRVGRRREDVERELGEIRIYSSTVFPVSSRGE